MLPGKSTELLIRAESGRWGLRAASSYLRSLDMSSDLYWPQWLLSYNCLQRTGEPSLGFPQRVNEGLSRPGLGPPAQSHCHYPKQSILCTVWILNPSSQAESQFCSPPPRIRMVMWFRGRSHRMHLYLSQPVCLTFPCQKMVCTIAWQCNATVAEKKWGKLQRHFREGIICS